MPSKKKATRKRNQVTCKCDAYPFPHREYGGKCNGYTEEEETCYTMEDLEHMYLGMSFRQYIGF